MLSEAERLRKEFRCYLAEFFGTFILIFCGDGAAVVDRVTNGSISHLGVGLSFGLALQVKKKNYIFHHQIFR
jgi:glycerol uptake facilitator-like aquaporin